MRILQSSDPEASLHRPSLPLQNFNVETSPPCPLKKCVINPPSISHTLTNPSAPPVATRVDVESVSMADTGVSCGLTECIRFPEGREYVRIISDREHVIRKEADGTRANAVIDSESCSQRRVSAELIPLGFEACQYYVVCALSERVRQAGLLMFRPSLD